MVPQTNNGSRHAQSWISRYSLPAANGRNDQTELVADKPMWFRFILRFKCGGYEAPIPIWRKVGDSNPLRFELAVV